MNCCQDINALFKDEISCIEGKMWDKTGRYCGSAVVKEELERLIDHMGVQSAECLGLDSPLTTFSAFKNSNQRIYLLKLANIFKQKGAVVAFARVGWRAISLIDAQGFRAQQDMLCLYDIYVATKFQRLGNGRRLLDFIFKHENVKPEAMTIDQPSQALLNFFMRQFFLREFTTQEHRYIVWKRYMDQVKPTAKSGVRYAQPIHTQTNTQANTHTHTGNVSHYMGGLWPVFSQPGDTLKPHPFTNWHPPTAATPGYNNELSLQELRVYNNQARNHNNNDRSGVLSIEGKAHLPFEFY
ncbi:putative Alpha-tubulin N-acetyltransferase 1 [Hypsibius exemplaris]|uniref:Alpha-tubulin N-acetyltransferase 1 n=1 Tax=Hypsibius exemplaris TaxID=2072580 RepID=A0A1W0XB32_HYPEX|nr:putative Alpha-tubulin N-acetyltransferase 1 [Hypsibius exemplaris]